MVARDDSRAIAQNHSALARGLYVLESTPEKSPDDVRRNQPAHPDYTQDPKMRATLVLAGPHPDATGDSEECAGLIANRAGSMARSGERKMLTRCAIPAPGNALLGRQVNEGNTSLNPGLSTTSPT